MSIITQDDVGSASRAPDLLSGARPRRLGILVNPQSGMNQRSLGTLLPILDRYERAIYRLVVKPQEVADALAEMAAQNVDVLGVCGGDGTLQTVLTALL